MIKSFKKSIVLCSTLFVSAVVIAQDTAPAPVSAAPVAPDNIILYLLIAACAVLLFAVFLLGNVMISLTKIALDKRAAKAASVILLLLFANFGFAQGGTSPTGDKVFQLPVNYDVYVGASVLFIELMAVIWMLFTIRSLINEIADEKTVAKPISFHLPRIFDNINASVAIEKEHDILLDHNYDGIRELDNSLPPWWKYSFYLSIVWAIGYLFYFYIGGGPSSIDEYTAEVQQAKIDVDAYNKKNALNVDESNVQYADAAGITEGQDIFKTNCIACHGNVGEGNQVGPNLTDDYWIHGGTANELFKTVKYGWPAKGMKSWETDLSAVQIKNVISYIHSLHGTNPPNAKAPQGDLFSEAGVVKSDSTIVAAVDSTQK